MSQPERLETGLSLSSARLGRRPEPPVRKQDRRADLFQLVDAHLRRCCVAAPYHWSGI